MTALKGRAINAFLNTRDPNVHAILIYGPDGGLVRERGQLIAKRVAPDLSDPFNAIELTDADLKDEPGRLGDELCALSFAGGERVVRLRTSGEAASKAVDILLAGLDSGHLKPNGIVVIEAGDLSPRSALRKAFDKSKTGASLPCYTDAPADVRALAQELAAAENLSFDKDALDLLVSALGDDHGVSRAEIDKLIMFRGPVSMRSVPATIDLDDVRATIAGGLGDAMNDAASAAADGEPGAVSLALYKAETAGASPIGMLRALQRMFDRLRQARALIDAGDSAASAMKKLRPPVFFAEERAFERRLYKWPAARLDFALRMLIETEMDAKSTGAPQRELVERAALRLAVMASR